MESVVCKQLADAVLSLLNAQDDGQTTESEWMGVRSAFLRAWRELNPDTTCRSIPPGTVVLYGGLYTNPLVFGRVIAGRGFDPASGWTLYEVEIADGRRKVWERESCILTHEKDLQATAL